MQTVNALVIEAIDSKVAGEATSRTALSKLYLAVSKALGEAGKGRKMAEVEETVAPVADEKERVTRFQEPAEETVLPEEVGRDGDMKMERMDVVEEAATEVTKDSILEELLDDDDEDVL